MSHELRTPMASMLGYVSLLLQNVYGDAPAAAGESAQARRASTPRNLLQLINNIFDLSKLSADRMSAFLRRRFPCDELTQEVVEAIEPLAGAKKLTLHGRRPGTVVAARRTKPN